MRTVSATPPSPPTPPCTPQDPLYRPNYTLSMAGFRDLTSQRVGKFMQARFFRM